MSRIPCLPRPTARSSLAWGLLAVRVLLGCAGDPRAPGSASADDSSRREIGPADGRDQAEAGTLERRWRAHGDDEDAGSAQGCAANCDWTAGDYPPELHKQTYLEISGVPGQAQKTRQYKVHVPTSYRPAQPAPVLFAFHGFGQNAVLFVVESTSLVSKSEEEGFILVMPNGLQEDFAGFGGSWNGGTCCGEAAAQKLDDVALVRAIYAAIRTHLNVDTSRVYATGLSNGGYLSHRLGCEAADIFVAIAPVAAAIGTTKLGPWLASDPNPDLERCAPTKPVAVLAMHGDADGIVPYEGMRASLEQWAARDGCDTLKRAATIPGSGGDTTCFTYVGCPTALEVTGCTVLGGGHCWFGDASGSCGTGYPGFGDLFVGNDSNFLDATDAVWSFLERFRR